MVRESENSKLWLTNAVGFMIAARLLLEDHKTGSMFHWPAFYTNLGFAYEHSLKGFLAFHGMTGDELRREIGHDLNKALSKAIDTGFQPHSPMLIEMLEILGPSHRKNEMRYLPELGIDTPENPDQACQCAWDHVQEVSAQLGAAHWE